jgi:hypothetical protein
MKHTTRAICRCAIALSVAAVLSSGPIGAHAQQEHGPRAYLGFDANDYPGDAALPLLRQTFAFAGYWLNTPPGSSPAESAANSGTWLGHRAALAQQGFGFLVLFNGRLDRELKSANASAVGASDARAAVHTAKREGFPLGTVIFVDQEEGGSMDNAQMTYLLAWFDGVTTAEFRAGIYCSGMPASEGLGAFTVTANFIRERAAGRKIVYFVYNDACPPSPGCTFLPNPPLPSTSGVLFAAIWQFAQSPRRRQFTRSCGSTYRGGHCYPPGMGPGSPFIDIESATSPDPSRAR